MLRNLAGRARGTFQRRTHAPRASTRPSSTFPGAPPPPPPSPPLPPRPSYFQAATIYPFILLSAITSLALNLGHQRTARETEAAHYRAQISVLEAILARLPRQTLSDAEQEDIERELELVGLGRGKDKAVVDAETSVREQTSWTEVFFGKKGKGYEAAKDDTDWEKVFHEADEAEKTRQAALPTAPAPAPIPASVVASSPPPPSPASAATPTPPPAPAQSKPTPRAVYL
ncbi:hypothetical protein JCM10450v2_000882 [Rhodotorula kratochvilovae]